MPSIEGFDDNVPRKGYGVYGEGYGKSSYSKGVYGYSHSSNGVHGLSSDGCGVRGEDLSLFFGSSGVGVYGGSGKGKGVEGWSGSGYGVYSYSHTGTGVYGESLTSYGVYGSSGYGPRAEVFLPPSRGVGVYGESSDNVGVYGSNISAKELVEGKSTLPPPPILSFRAGVYGGSYSGYGVNGYSSSNVGVNGQSYSGTGVNGYSHSSGIGVNGSSSNVGVYGYGSSGYGVGGESNSGYGVYGHSNSGLAAYLDGRVHINGLLTKTAGSFKIDHPLDPANKYLSHSFVESPDMKNVYDGVAVLDDKGEAEIELPDWFGKKWAKEFAFITSLLELLCIDIGSLVGNPLVE